jgi:hypothetical protein
MRDARKIQGLKLSAGTSVVRGGQIACQVWRDITDVTDPDVNSWRRSSLLAAPAGPDRCANRGIRHRAACSADRGAGADLFYDDFGERRLEATNSDMILL